MRLASPLNPAKDVPARPRAFRDQRTAGSAEPPSRSTKAGSAGTLSAPGCKQLPSHENGLRREGQLCRMPSRMFAQMAALGEGLRSAERPRRGAKLTFAKISFYPKADLPRIQTRSMVGCSLGADRRGFDSFDWSVQCPCKAAFLKANLPDPAYCGRSNSLQYRGTKTTRRSCTCCATVQLSPLELQTRIASRLPFHLNPAVAFGQGTILDGVGRKLVKRHAQILNRAG